MVTRRLVQDDVDWNIPRYESPQAAGQVQEHHREEPERPEQLRGAPRQRGPLPIRHRGVRARRCGWAPLVAPFHSTNETHGKSAGFGPGEFRFLHHAKTFRYPSRHGISAHAKVSYCDMLPHGQHFHGRLLPCFGRVANPRDAPQVACRSNFLLPRPLGVLPERDRKFSGFGAARPSNRSSPIRNRPRMPPLAICGPRQPELVFTLSAV